MLDWSCHAKELVWVARDCSLGSVTGWGQELPRLWELLSSEFSLLIIPEDISAPKILKSILLITRISWLITLQTKHPLWEAGHYLSCSSSSQIFWDICTCCRCSLSCWSAAPLVFTLAAFFPANWRGAKSIWCLLKRIRIQKALDRRKLLSFPFLPLCSCLAFTSSISILARIWWTLCLPSSSAWLQLSLHLIFSKEWYLSPMQWEESWRESTHQK